MRKKVLLLTNMYPSKKHPHYGIFIKHNVEFLETKYKVHIISLKKHNNKIVKIAVYLLFYLKAVIFPLCKKYDCIYAHYVSHSALPILIIKKIKPNLKIIENAHGEDVLQGFEKSDKNMKWTAKVLKVTDYLFVPSKFYKVEVARKYGYPENKIIVSPSGGVNLEIFKKEDTNQSRKKLNLQENSFYIGYISRVEAGKGWDTFLRAIWMIKTSQQVQNLRVLFVGGGEEYKQCLKLIKKLGLEDDIDYFPLLNQKMLNYAYNSLNIFCFPTRRHTESLGLVGLEAMACEIPCVISNESGPASYFNNRNNSLIFDKNSAEDCAIKITQLVKMEESEKKKLTEQGLRTAQKYDSCQVEEDFIKQFENCLEG